MCGNFPELRLEQRTGKTVKIFFIAPQTKEQLCERCNKINDDLAKSHGDNRVGELKVVQE